MRKLAPITILLVSLGAADARADGAAGRLTGDVALSAEVGAGVVQSDALGALQMRALYVATAGGYASLTAPFSDSQGFVASTGVEVRPLFLPRFLLNLERDRDTLDLALDSLSFGMGLAVQRHGAPALELTTGFELPLLARFDGPFLGAHLMYAVSHERQLGEGSTRTAAFLTLGFRGLAWTHVVDAGDRVQR